MKRIPKKILRRLIQGYEDAFEFVYRKYKRLLYGIIYKLIMNENDIDDILAEIFQSIWDNVSEIDLDSGNFENWVITITYNKTRNYLKGKNIYESYVYNSNEKVMEATGDANGALSSIFLNDIKKRLTSEQYNVLVGRDIKKLKFKQMSKLYNAPQTTLRREYYRAKIVVDEYFRGEDNE